jgi:hypothetical protein
MPQHYAVEIGQDEVNRAFKTAGLIAKFLEERRKGLAPSSPEELTELFVQIAGLRALADEMIHIFPPETHETINGVAAQLRKGFAQIRDEPGRTAST